MKKILFVIFVFTANIAFSQEPQNWRHTAETDLAYMYQMYRANHAGGVDPNNPGFNKKLQKEYKESLKKTKGIKNETDYQQALKDFFKPFNDGHMGVMFNNELSGNPENDKLPALRRPLSMELFNNGGAAWVYINSFAEKEDLFVKLSKQLADAGDKDIIVLDLRYNTGGSPFSAAFLLEGLYGKAYADYIDLQTKSKQRIYLRATPWVLESLEKTISFFNMTPSAEMSGWAEKVKEALDKGEKTVVVEHKNIYTPQYNNLKARVYVLTDKYCASACLMFLDAIKEIGNIPRLGAATNNTDTMYMHSWAEPLPSGQGRFAISYLGYLKRQRKSNEPYKPDYYYTGDLNNTGEVQKWVLDLDGKINKKTN